MPTLFIVGLNVSYGRFEETSRGVDGLRVIRELAPGRAVVQVDGEAPSARLLALDGVRTAVEDTREHPQQ